MSRLDCTVCHRVKKPVGRSAPLEMANGLCDDDCPGYRMAPEPVAHWPNEECAARDGDLYCLVCGRDMLVVLECLNCKKTKRFAEDSPHAQGIFNYFCDGDCEDDFVEKEDR